MKIKSAFFVFFFLISSSIYSQTKKDSTAIKTIDEFKTIMSLQFSKILTGNSFTNFGRYVSVSNTDKTLSISGTIINNKESVWGFEISGGATNGVSSIFNNGDLNSNVGGKITYNRIINPFKKNRISYNEILYRKMDEKKKELAIKFKLDSLNVVLKKELITSEYTIKSLTKKLIKLDSLRKSYSNSTNSLKKDSINYAYEKTKFESIQLNKKIKFLSNDEYIDTKLEEIYQKYDESLLEIQNGRSKLGIEDIDLTWFSLGYGFRNDAFKLFDESLPLEEQISKDSYISHQINIGISRYRWGRVKKNDVFWSLGMNFNYSSNLLDLDTKEIVDTTPISQNPQRDIVKEQDVFVGEFKEGVKKIGIFFDYYQFLGAKNSFALHMNPRVIIADDIKPITTLQSGILIPFKKQDKQSSFVNVEIFYQLNDIFNTSDSTDSLLKRNTIGLQASFPINFSKPK
ncbi:MAG: hypothetical protein PSN34_14100 [Urechidicola sp.]|nr:hypothetical protein [Urechidicola sp.]